MVDFTAVEDPISLDAHALRHQQNEKDEMSIKGLKGEPQAIDDIMTYYGTTVTYGDKVVTRST